VTRSAGSPPRGALDEAIRQIEKNLADLDSIVNFLLDRDNVEVYYKNWGKDKPFREALRGILSALSDLRTKINAPELLPQLSGLEDQVRGLHGKMRLKKYDLRQRVEGLRASFLRLRPRLSPVAEIGVDVAVLPEEIREEFGADLAELSKCMSVGAWRSSLFLCGRLLELTIGRKYWEKTRVDPLEKRWTLGTLIEKADGEGVLASQPELVNLVKVIKDCRNPSTHVTMRLYSPGEDDVPPLVELTGAIIRRLYPVSS